ncbi:GatB/YqeY domain-containing protein [Candidatus Nomurabacteria bacterium]|nr:GatB/YqeY domain-containing protein [Candidatus Nomurabacteria bacterium]
MSLQNDIKEQIKQALMAKDQTRLSTVRGISSAITNTLVAKGKTPQDELSDEEVLEVITKLAKQRKDSISQFEAGGRTDLVESEKAELAVLKEFLPEEMSEDAIKEVIEKYKSDLGIDDPSKKGMLLGVVMKELKGKADGNVVKSLVDNLF